MEEISKSVDEVTKTISELNKSSKQIGKMILTIDDIADQTNFLALNAASEPERSAL